MVVPVETIIRDLTSHDINYTLALKIVNYVQENVSGYTPEELDRIDGAADDMEAYFNPQHCSDVERITVKAKGGYIRYNRDQSVGVCEQAKQMGVTLHDYFVDVVPSYETYTLKRRTPTTYAREMLKEMTGQAEKQPSKSTVRQPLKPSEGELRVEAGSIIRELNRLREDLTEETETIRRGYENQLRQIREALKELAEKGTIAQPIIEPAKEPYRMTIPLTATEYDILRTTPDTYMHKFIRKEGKNYIVEFQDDSKADIEDLVNEIKFKASEKLEEKRKARPPPMRLAGQEDLKDEFVRIFKEETDRKPNAADLAILNALTKDLLKLYYDLEGQEADYKHLFNMDLSLDLTPQKKLTSERATEVFNRLKATLQSLIGKRITETQQDICDEDSIADSFFNYYVYNLMKDEGKELTPSELKEYDNSYGLLTACGYDDSKFKEYLERTIGYYEERGANWDQMIDNYVGGK